ncbi:retrotransposon ORF1 [Tanacetum coccineum]
MEPSSSVGKTCLGENVIEISSDKAEGHGDWNSPEFQDTANSRGKKETKAMVFHKMETQEISDRFVAPCFVNGLEVYDGEINLGVEENMISNEFAVKLCLDHKVKRGNKVVKKELIVALRGEIYFVKFIINPEEDDVEPGVVFGRSFLRLTKAIANFETRTITIYPELDLFLVSSKKEGKISDDWDLLLDHLDFGDIPDIEGVDVPQFVQEVEREALAISICEIYSLIEEDRPVIETMAYSDKYKKILDGICLDKIKLDGMNKEEEEAIIKIKGEALIEKDDPGAFVIPIRLEGNINLNALADTGSDINVMPCLAYKELGREEVQNVKKGITMLNHSKAEPVGLLSGVLCQVGVTTIIAKFLILDIPIDRDTPILVGGGFLHTCGGILNTIDSITSTFDGICHQTFRAAKTSLDTAESDSDDEEEYAIQRNKFGAPIYGPKPARYLNCNDPLDQSLALQEVSNSFRKICVWKKVVSFLGSLLVALQHVEWKPSYTRCFNRNEDSDGQWHAEIRLIDPYGNIYDQDFTMGTHDDEIGSSRTKRSRQYETVEEFYSTYEFDEVCADDELKTKKIIMFRLGGHAHSLTLLEFARRLGLYHAEELDEEGFDVREENLSLSRSHASTIKNPVLRVLHKMITYGLCQRTTGYDKIQKNDLWLLSMFDARHQNGYANVAWLIARWINRKGAGTQRESMICYGQFITKLARKARVLSDEVLRSLSAPIYCRDLDTITLRELINSEGRLIPEAPQPNVPRVTILRPQRASMQDLYERIGSMEIRQGAIKRMAYRHSYHWDRYAGVFEHMAEVYNVPLQGAYNLPGYDQQQYQYYQQYPPQQQQPDNE